MCQVGCRGSAFLAKKVLLYNRKIKEEPILFHLCLFSDITTNKSDMTFDNPLFNVLEQCAKLVVEEVHS